MNTQAIVFRAPDVVELGRFELPCLGAGDLRVKTRYTFVSSGTELRVLGGHYGAQANFPLVPGYCFVGEVVEVGSEAGGFRVGDWVSGGGSKPLAGVGKQWGGQAEFHVCESSGNGAPVVLPRGAAPLDYIITEIAAISSRGVFFAAPRSGETAIVIGQGLIGAFSAALLSAAGCRVVVCDLSPRRLERALKWGVAAALDAGDERLRARLGALCPGGADIVVESSGSAPGLELAHDLVARSPWKNHDRSPPRLVLQANYLHRETRDPFAFFEGEQLQLITPIDRRIADRVRVVELIRKGQLSSAPFLDAIEPWKGAPAAYARLGDHPDECFSLVFDWADER